MPCSVKQTWAIYRGEDASIVLTGENNTNPTGWALLATVKASVEDASPVLFTTSFTVGGGGPYTLTFGFTRAQTSALTLSTYPLDVWRTDPGGNYQLAVGTLYVLTPVRSPE